MMEKLQYVVNMNVENAAGVPFSVLYGIKKKKKKNHIQRLAV